MKKCHLFILLAAFLFACKEKESNYLPYLLAGQTDGIGIRYTNIDPDEDLPKPAYPQFTIKELDLNGDNVNDFELKYGVSNPLMLGAGGSNIKITPLGTNAVCVANYADQWVTAINYNDSLNHWVDSLRFNDTIGADCNWLDTTALLFSNNWMYDGTNYFYGYWYDNPDIYVGVKISTGEEMLYGWIDLYRNTIRGYAVTVPY